MDTIKSSTLIIRIGTLLTICTLLSACGGGGGGGDEASSDSSQNHSTTIHYATDGAISLSWDSPLYRVDGTPIHPDDIDFYTIKYKKAGESTYSTIVIAGTSDTLEIDISEAGTYEFIISATDHGGTRSAYTSPIYSTIV